MIPDQKKMWNDKHSVGDKSVSQDTPNSFAVEVLKLLKAGNNLLELGCGKGADSRLFAEKGIHTFATDFSEEAIGQNKKRNKFKNLTYEILDITDKYPYQTKSFDYVYAHLSLHYYSDEQTEAILEEISRILKRGGATYVQV